MRPHPVTSGTSRGCAASGSPLMLGRLVLGRLAVGRLAVGRLVIGRRASRRTASAAFSPSGSRDTCSPSPLLGDEP
ncbi:hypothetical protein [Microbispora hainanensis]|uniref:Uncharacterized protein n=1 Tax=Microbispora hainanensis TaxID=568844 RepID=A0ABZ1SZT4_9ACTN|nr:hypothetical protein [Microbispora hainanensis]